MLSKISTNRALLAGIVYICLANNHLTIKSAIGVPRIPTQDIKWEIKPRATDNFSKAAFRIWIPENVKRLRGLLVLMKGWNKNGLSLADQEIWRTFASKNRFALVAGFLQSDMATLKGPNWMNHCYWMTERGSGKALIDALKKFSELADRPEIENLPMLMWGHSAGGQFNYSFACYAPERIIGFVSIKGVYYFSKATSQTRKVPAMFILGENDHYKQIPKVMSLFKKQRSLGARWAVAVEPNAGHKIGKSNDLILPFFNALIEKQLKDEKNNYKDMKPVKPLDDWLGNLKTFSIYPYKEYPGDIKEAAWLPDKNVAEVWQRFVTTENQDSQKKKIKSRKAEK
jgi:predicted esterase